ncbi:MAG: hypothetical protein DDG60_01470 [Anaerolineae bacterium]|nr:MAG: hypothetical protein DDG60_01470 [Anaerolineae bacterium]
MTTPTGISETNGRIPRDRVYFGLLIAVLGFIVFLFGAKPDWFGQDRSPVVGFVQITVFLIGLAFICLGGYLGLAALWAGQEKSIAADIGLRLISTGYVIAVFTGMADIFGATIADTPKVPFFGPWQAVGVQIGMGLIALGMILVVPPSQTQKTETE